MTLGRIMRDGRQRALGQESEESKWSVRPESPSPSEAVHPGLGFVPALRFGRSVEASLSGVVEGRWQLMSASH